MDPNPQFEELNLKIQKTLTVLDGVSESTVIILLVKYNWDSDLLHSDYQKMLSVIAHCGFKNCITESPPLEVYSHCSLCESLESCLRINCAHQFCTRCLKDSVDGQLSQQRLVLECPVCKMYINCKNLPQNLLTQYLLALQRDLQQKTSFSVQCVSFAWRHKGALATGLSLGYAVYVGFSWRHEMGYALRAFRFGSEVKSFATSFKKLVKSGSQTLTGFFSR